MEQLAQCSPITGSLPEDGVRWCIENKLKVRCPYQFPSIRLKRVNSKNIEADLSPLVPTRGASTKYHVNTRMCTKIIAQRIDSPLLLTTVQR